MNIQKLIAELNAVNSAEMAGMAIANFVKAVKTNREAAKVIAQLADAGFPADDLQGFIQMLQEVTGWSVSVEMGRFYSDVDDFEAKADKHMADFDKEVSAGMVAFEERSKAEKSAFEERVQFKRDNFFQDAKKFLG